MDSGAFSTGFSAALSGDGSAVCSPAAVSDLVAEDVNGRRKEERDKTAGDRSDVANRVAENRRAMMVEFFAVDVVVEGLRRDKIEYGENMKLICLSHS